MEKRSFVTTTQPMLPVGLEPTLSNEKGILSPSRLPITPQEQLLWIKNPPIELGRNLSIILIVILNQVYLFI